MPDRVSPGQPLKDSPLRKAATVNNLLATGDYYRERMLGKPPNFAKIDWPTDIVRVKNSSGADLSRGRCLQLGNFLLDDFDPRKIWFDADYPATPLLERIAILLRPIPNGEIGLAQVSGVCIANVNVGNTDHTRAIPQSGSGVLASDMIGPIQLLSPADGTGAQDMAVLLAGPTGDGIRKGKADSAITAGSSGTVSVYDETGSDTGENVTAYLDWAEGGENISSGKELFFCRIGARYVIIGAECE